MPFIAGSLLLPGELASDVIDERQSMRRSRRRRGRPRAGRSRGPTGPSSSKASAYVGESTGKGPHPAGSGRRCQPQGQHEASQGWGVSGLAARQATHFSAASKHMAKWKGTCRRPTGGRRSAAWIRRRRASSAGRRSRQTTLTSVTRFTASSSVSRAAVWGVPAGAFPDPLGPRAHSATRMWRWYFYIMLELLSLSGCAPSRCARCTRRFATCPL